MHLPTWHHEKELFAAGFRLIAGVDEAGMGCLAGPVVAAAAILHDDARIGLIRDSKLLSAKQREEVVGEIKEHSVSWAVGVASVEEIDELNIRRAGLLAMRRAVEGLASAPDFVLVDGFPLQGLAMPSRHIVQGDAKVKSIAAASIIAKTTRDAMMLELDVQFPGYGLAKHKGYATAEHRRALALLGPSSLHRQSYAPVRESAAALKKSMEIFKG